jgi:hypothetical protein
MSEIFERGFFCAADAALMGPLPSPCFARLAGDDTLVCAVLRLAGDDTVFTMELGVRLGVYGARKLSG